MFFGYVIILTQLHVVLLQLFQDIFLPSDSFSRDAAALSAIGVFLLSLPVSVVIMPEK